LMLAYLTPLADPEAEAHGAQLFTRLRDLLALRLQNQVVAAATAEVRDRALARIKDTRPLFIEELSTSIAPLTVAAPESASFVALDRRVREAQMRVYLGWVGKPWPHDIRDAATSTACYIPDEKRVWLSPPLLKPPYLGTLPETAATYGGAGAVMGHELAHGLPGAVRVSPVNGAAAGGVEPYACLEEHFSEMARIWKLPFNGQRAVEEYSADLTGTRLALAAMLADASGDAATRTRRIKEFFVAYAQFYCATDGDFRSDVETARDSHPSVLLRINGVVSQIDEFARAFACQPGQPMAPVSRCIAPWP
jgi:putative endopeptidase